MTERREKAMNKMHRTAIATALLLSACAPVAAAGDILFDEAEVVDAQPLYESRRVEQPVQRCGYEPDWTDSAPDPGVLGDVRGSRPHEDLSTALGSELVLRDSRQSVYRCRTLTELTEESVLAGYRVTYRYDGRTYERHFAERPGDRIRVRVRISAGESRLLTHGDRGSNGQSNERSDFAVRQTAW